MKTSNELPPNYKAIAAAFDLRGVRAIFTYGDTVYNVQSPMPEHLQAHERTHMAQQRMPALWWERYLAEPEFRYSQELEAYRAQYARAKETVKDRNRLAALLQKIARDLASPMYGSVVSYTEALNAIRA